MSQRLHVAVVGSGIAGLIAALRLSKQHDVTLVTKNELAESNTRWAQGGIAAVMFEDDNVENHIIDTLNAGAGLCDPAAVRVLCEEGPERIQDLIRFGVQFDKRNGELAKGLEAAHSYPRVLHAGGDSTGLSIEMALVHAVCSNKAITVLEHTFVADILTRNDQCIGLHLIDRPQNGKQERSRMFTSDAVILASGGAGQLYLHTTNPSVATGDGTAAAFRAGAEVADVEFYQFHPTALAHADTFLISEAVRGEGAVLLDAHGRRFMQAVHPGAELAPRDIVARGIAMQMAAQNGAPVMLDATRLGGSSQPEVEEFLRTRFPSIDAAVRRRGMDWSREPIPVTPAAHYWMGGVRTDLYGRTSVPRLFAVGETACTGVHGANRLASNSLLESLVYAWRCAGLFLGEHIAPSASLDAPAEFDANEVRALAPPYAAERTIDRRGIQSLMWNAAGIERNAEDLTTALAELKSTRVEVRSIADRETANLHLLARLVTTAALARTESRGGHFRNDFPNPNPAWARSLVYADRSTPVRIPANPLFATR
ncbi:L-aspartate oxidase [Granulicella cerasi]|uniref:L-aspartate oxidase n=1 Tax=Granulicella cerasi TaxID=741063 RepID=A0ABW1Z6P0_9BACT|nr:L-aspartate oxidase [Granulicella cerasi]